jgi:DnaK suppressor protein
MASPRSEKKKKHSPTKTRVQDLKKKKKIIKKSPKKLVRKVLKKPIKKKPIEKPPQKDGNASIRKVLMGLREKLLAGISETISPAVLAAPSDIGDLVDQAGDERDRELSILLTDRDKEKLQAIDEALEKLTEGTYGICEDCGEKIGHGRIKVMPLAKFCVNCQAKIEREVSLLRRAEEDLKYRGLANAPGMEEEET